jgi:glycosyltransferase involved in cell wall biosynthesis
MNLKITATLTCYNREGSILKALESIRDQSEPFHEVIICDDASTDSSVSIIRDFISDHNLINFKLILHDINGGQNAALNSAISASTGDVICFLDSDDAWLPNVSAILKSHWTKDTPMEVGVQYGWIQGGPRWHLEGCDLLIPTLMQGYLSCLGTLSIRRSFLNSILPLETRPEISDRCQDDRICFELVKICCVRLIPADLLIYGGAEGNSASNQLGVARGWEIFFSDYEGYYRENNLIGYLSFHNFRVSLMYFSCRSYSTGIRLFLASIKELRQIEELKVFYIQVKRLIQDKIDKSSFVVE